MADPQAPTAPPVPFATRAGLQAVFDLFRSGGVAACPNEGVPMALAVDGAAAAYRLVCTQCGVASDWFEATLGEVKLRDASSPRVGAGEK